MTASARDLDLRQHHGVETPEHVDVRFELAGVGSRVAAGLCAIALQSCNKRLGDTAAGTIVVRDRRIDWTLGLPGTPAPEAAAEAVETGPPDLSEEEFRLLDRFLGRLNELAPDVQARITADLVRRFEPRIPRRTPDLQSYLVTVFAEEQRKRRSRFASRAQAGTAGRITLPAER